MSSKPNPEPRWMVLDTNIVLDLFLFQDPRFQALRSLLDVGACAWVATPHMRNELERVLTYPHIQTKMEAYRIAAAEILQNFDRVARMWLSPSPKAAYTCKDADDQPFIDLACALATANPGQKVHLMSKDKAVLSMRKRLEKLSVFVTMTICD